MVYIYWHSTVTGTWYTAIDTAMCYRNKYSHWHCTVTGMCNIQLLTQQCHTGKYCHWYNTVTGTWHTAIDTALSQGHIQQVTMQCHRDMTYSYWYRPLIRMCNIQLLTQHCYKGHHSHWYSTIILTGRHTAIDAALSRGAIQLCSLSQKDPYNQRQISIRWCNIVTQTEGIYSDISQCHRHIQS